jgi:hypothetical protein
MATDKTETTAASTPAKPNKPAKKVKAKFDPKTRRKGSKQSKMIALLMSPKGATIAEVAKACDYTMHTASAAVHGGRMRSFGFKITGREDEKRGTVYTAKLK